LEESAPGLAVCGEAVGRAEAQARARACAPHEPDSTAGLRHCTASSCVQLSCSAFVLTASRFLARRGAAGVSRFDARLVAVAARLGPMMQEAFEGVKRDLASTVSQPRGPCAHIRRTSAPAGGTTRDWPKLAAHVIKLVGASPAGREVRRGCGPVPLL
jgi:hypothetical protein